MPEISPLIRLFVSSTFSDFAFEREILQRAVFPRLRALCAAQGCRFQPIDLRWGVSEEAGNEKRTLAICLDEIARCQRLSPDLNFLILLGDRYGSCFLPERIPSDQVARLVLYLAPAERDAFARAYKEDLNALRPEYVLLPSDGSGDARQLEEPLRAALAQAAQAAGFTEQELLPLVASATHLEIQRGLLDAGCDPSAALCAIRSFESMPEESRTAQYVEQDPGRRMQLKALTAAVGQRLGGRVWRYGAPGRIVGPRMGRAARALYRALSEQFYALLEPRIQEALALRQSAAQTRDSGAEANHQFAESRASVVVGREDALDRAAAYLAGQTPLPLVVTGESGVGKSTLLARVVEDAASKHPNAVIVTRYIGVTPGTSSLADLLSGLRREIAERYGQPAPEPLSELSQFVATFANQLSTLEAPAEQPFFLVVDALDQLSAKPQRMDWLPRTLAPHVRVVLSTLSDRQELVNLRGWLPETQFLRLDPINREQGVDVLRAWLAAEGRRVTSAQENAVLDGFAPTPEGRGTPLYLRLAFEQARTWRSFEHAMPLPPTTTELIQTYFSELEEPGRHGRELVAYALGDIAAARHGLAEDELLDVLSRSAAVREALRQLSPGAPPIKPQGPLPVALWARLAADLERYLTEREADGARMVTFYHRQVLQKAERRYLNGADGTARHTDLAAYFGGQPYRLGESSEAIWNRRKLAEVAYQQARMEAVGRQALETTLTDGRFLEGKLTVEGVAATLDDLALAPGVVDVDTIVTVLRAGSVVLAKDPAELENQIRGRVGFVPTLHHLPEHLAPWLRLQSNSLHTNRALVQTLQGHADEVVNCALSADGERALSASEDGTLRVWDTASGETLYILDDHERYTVVTEGRRLLNQVKPVDGCAFSADGQRALSLKSGVLRLWDTMSGRVLRVFSGRVSNLGKTGSCCALSADGRLALFALDSSTSLSSSDAQQVSLWDTTSGQTRATWNLRGSYILACILSADGTRALVASRGGGLWVWSTITQRALRTLPRHTDGLASCAMSADGRRALSASEADELRLWDIETGRLLRTLQGHQGRVYRCALNADGQVALAASADGVVRLWNTDTGTVVRAFDESLLRTVRSLDYGTACALSADGQRLLAAADQHTLQLWDTVHEEMPAGVQKGWEKGVTDCVLNDDGRIALTGYENGTLRTWDTTTKQLQHAWTGHRGVVHVCTLSADGQMALSLAKDGMRVWETVSGTTLIVLKNRPGTAHIGALSANGRVAVSLRLTALMGLPTRLTLGLWDTRHKRPLRAFKGMGGSGGPCALSADGQTVIAASNEGFSMWSLVGALVKRKRDVDLDSSTLHMWDAASGSVLHSLYIDGTITDCVLSADGQRVLFTADSALEHGALYNWHSVDSRPLLMLAGDKRQGVVRCALSADGQRALSASADGILRLWDIVDSREITRWTHDKYFRSCALSADGRLAAAVDIAGAAYILDVMSVAPTTNATGAALPMT